MNDLDVLNELLNSSSRVRKTVKAYIVKAYQRGVKAGKKSMEAEFDELLERIDRLGHMNGSTELFKAKWEEAKGKKKELTTAAEIDKAVCEFITGREQYKSFDESKHPRGQPDNAGQFGPGGGDVSGQFSKVVGKDILQEITESFPEGIRRQHARSAAISDSPKWFEVHALRDGDGKLIGVASVWKDPDTGSQGMPEGQYIRVGNLASSPGHGRELFNKIIEVAHKKGAGLELTDTEASSGFYQKMGMKGGENAGTWYLTSEDVKRLLSGESNKSIRKAQREPDDENDNHTIAAAMMDYALEAREHGHDPIRGLVALAALADDPNAFDDLIGRGELHKAFDEGKHPRDEAGKFISKHELHAAKNDPAKAAELRKRVRPEDRDKLEGILKGEVDPGHTKRSERQEANRQKRGTKAASKAAAKETLNRIRLNKSVTTDDILDLRDHLSALTVDELRLQRQAFGASWLGAKVKKDMVARLIDHAWDASGAERPKTIKEKKPRAESQSESLYQMVRAHGGIDPESSALKAVIGGVSEAREYGLALGLFKNGGNGLDAIASELAGSGHISVPEGVSPEQHLVDELRKGAYSRHAEISKQYERAEDDYWKIRSDAEAEHTPAEVGEAVSGGEEAGISEAANGDVGDSGESTEPQGEVDTSFDFGANETAPIFSPEEIQTAELDKQMQGPAEKPERKPSLEH